MDSGAQKTSEMMKKKLSNTTVLILLITVILVCHHRTIGIKENDVEDYTIEKNPDDIQLEKKHLEKFTYNPEVAYRPRIKPHVTPGFIKDGGVDLKRGFIAVSEIDKLVQRITLNKDVYRQGEVAVLIIGAVRPLESARIKFLGRSYSLVKGESERSEYLLYETVLAVPINADTGSHKMELIYLDDDRGEQKKRELPFRVIEGEFREADTSEVDLPMLTEETMTLLRFEHRYFARGYLNNSKEKLYDGDFIWPAQGRITGIFGVSRKYNEGKDRWTHKAIDIANYLGAKVVACNNGRISMVEDLEAHGKSLMIDHGAGIHSIYLHLDTVYVKKGDRVKKGQRIGKMGDTGFCTGPNLHWQVMVNRVATDPRQWLAPSESERKKGEYVKPTMKKVNN